MPLSFEGANVAQLIQLSVAPVFLLAGIGAIITVTSTRIGRIFNRTHDLAALLDTCDAKYEASLIQELRVLTRRISVALWAIGLCALAELMVCLLIAMHFFSGISGLDLSFTAAIIFLSAMVSLILGLLTFLYEIFLAMMSARITNQRYIDRIKKSTILLSKRK